jgi:hypothetical protein
LTIVILGFIMQPYGVNEELNVTVFFYQEE